jgi:hypothetical protein
LKITEYKEQRKTYKQIDTEGRKRRRRRRKKERKQNGKVRQRK